ncbi:MAG: hypothetical protein HY852_05785 [Bradyrhizobium sp.]|uniref:hypothetical protein n=1 Tax=Bradyrhizobium sp. TaxID=376 RepID=UPI0025C3B99A|nr:hypothetical protein [Bradyrhizobium sp.]MBI5261315.1 hypothetical protein [Bradyrhizobium sp.]
MGWLSRCLLGAVMLVLACRVATAWFGAGLAQPTVTTRDGSLVTLNRYVREPMPDVVLVGSSVTFRLKEDYFLNGKVRNLALAGGSPLTGLMVVANQPKLPKIILIETNVLSRAVDTRLVEKFAGMSRPDPLFFRPVRTAVAAYETWLHSPPGYAQMHAARDKLLSQAPSNFDNHVFAERALRQMNEEYPVEAVRANVEELRRQLELIEGRGAKALLIEVPYSQAIEGSRFVELTKESLRSAFPDPALWLQIDAPRAELRWADGVHLDERSAVLVVRSIEKALADRSTTKPSN